ncbi:MAG TPA: hypothetical protein VG796_01005 [Verrucomicrobiales bacterium]|nr:hypothetical protein [Verrucomicrobiales bacterium]
MKSLRCLTFRLIAGFVAIACLPAATAQSGTELLLPFPSDAATDAPAATQAAAPARTDVTGRERKEGDNARALELAETFIRRQQMEVSNSVPLRAAPTRVPLRSAPSGSKTPPVIATHTNEANAPESSGPSSELLPLPGDDAPGQPLESLLPDPSAILPGGGGTPETPLPNESEDGVPRDDLAPAPSYGGVEDQDRRGPVFRVSGADAFKLARARGFKFTPANGIGVRDGAHTAASQFPNVLTSEVHGTRMSQLRPPAAWAVTETSNTFFMFCDARYNAVRLAPGWRIRGIKLDGPNWRWVACPRSGANTASFSIRIYAYKNQQTATAVQLAGLTLEGPDGATDWREAFPSLNGKGLLPPSQPAGHDEPEALVKTRSKGSDALETAAKSSSKAAEPPLPQ